MKLPVILQFAQRGLLFRQSHRKWLLPASGSAFQSNCQACPSKKTLGENANASDALTTQFRHSKGTANVSSGLRRSH